MAVMKATDKVSLIVPACAFSFVIVRITFVAFDLGNIYDPILFGSV